MQLQKEPVSSKVEMSFVSAMVTGIDRVLELCSEFGVCRTAGANNNASKSLVISF